MAFFFWKGKREAISARAAAAETAEQRGLAGPTPHSVGKENSLRAWTGWLPLGGAAGAWSRLLGACGGKGPSVERPPCPEPILWPLGPGQPRKAGRPSQEDTRPREPRLSLPCPSPFPPSLALGTHALGHPFCFQTCSHLRHLGAPSPTSQHPVLFTRSLGPGVLPRPANAPCVPEPWAGLCPWGFWV